MPVGRFLYEPGNEYENVNHTERDLYAWSETETSLLDCYVLAFPLRKEYKRFFIATKYLISYNNDCSTANRDLIERLTWMRVNIYACTDKNVLLLCT
jgi:hypothetical protein